MAEACPNDAAKIRVLVVDDHKVVRVGLRAMISHEPDMEVVAEAGDGRRRAGRLRQPTAPTSP